MFQVTLQALGARPHLEHPVVLAFLRHPELQVFLSNPLLLVDQVPLFSLDLQSSL